jgi:hypothetical protein
MGFCSFYTTNGFQPFKFKIFFREGGEEAAVALGLRL